MAVTQPSLSSAAECAAVEENFWSMWSQFGRAPGCALHQESGLTWFETPIPVPPYNMVVRLACEAEDAAAAIDALDRHFRARRVRYLWALHPSARPASAGALLEARGFAEVEDLAGMAADLRELPPVSDPPAGVEIHTVTPERDAGAFLEFVASRWQVPEGARGHLQSIADNFRIGAPGSPNRAWIATRDGVTLAKVFTHDAPGHVGVYGMATKPESRGLGLGRLVCVTALDDARRRGHTLAVLHSTPMAVRLYEGVGFRHCGTFRIYAEPGSFYA
jgi:ribosomal protein S18 acetylase RimI-like enzyme